MFDTLRDNAIEDAGFAAPKARRLGHEHRSVAIAALIASTALAICTIVAATAVSVGIARAGVADGMIDNDGSVFTIALLLALIFIGIGGFTVLPPGGRPRH